MLGLALQGPSVSAGLQMLAGAAKPPGPPEVAFPEALLPAARPLGCKLTYLFYSFSVLFFVLFFYPAYPCMLLPDPSVAELFL